MAKMDKSCLWMCYHKSDGEK